MVTMKNCPYCNEDLQIVCVDIEGFDVLGCEQCDWNELDKNNLEEMEWYL